MAIFQSLHTEMPMQQLGSRYVERCRRIWWTVYILDRETTSLMGLPPTIHDDDVTCPLPDFSGATQRVTTLHMQVKLCRIIANINKSKPSRRREQKGLTLLQLRGD
jgi:proline utilization trans-activator